MSSFANAWLVSSIFGFALLIFHLQLCNQNSEIFITKFDSKPVHFFPLTYIFSREEVIWNLEKAGYGSPPLTLWSRQQDGTMAFGQQIINFIKSAAE